MLLNANKCYFYSCQKNLNVRKQKDSIWCEVIAVLLPFVPKTWHFWAWEEKQIRGTDSFWVWEHLVFITPTNLRWRRIGGDMKAGSINLFAAFKQQYSSNDEELKTEMEEIERKYMKQQPRQWFLWPAAKDHHLSLLCAKCFFLCCFKYRIILLTLYVDDSHSNEEKIEHLPFYNFHLHMF